MSGTVTEHKASPGFSLLSPSRSTLLPNNYLKFIMNPPNIDNGARIIEIIQIILKALVFAETLSK